jgi:hypothetical protein
MLKGRQSRFVLVSIGGWSLARLGVWLTNGAVPMLGVGLLAGGVLIGLALRWPQPTPRAAFVPAKAGWRPHVERAAAPAPSAISGHFDPLPDLAPADRAPQLLRFAVGRMYPASAQAALRHAVFAAPAPRPEAAPSPPPAARLAAPSASRWSVSAYLFVRQGSGRPGLAANGQLGGSQAAARISYRLNRDGPVRTAISARFYAPLEGKGAEGAVGLDWYPLPGRTLRLSVERRVALDSAGRDAWSAYAAGGFYAEPARGITLDGYAQTGLVGLHARDAFVDGAMRAGLRLGRMTIGGGLWGAAQPGVARLDAGPRFALAVPAGKGIINVVVEGRFRLAGRVNPGSGATLTLASDF